MEQGELTRLGFRKGLDKDHRNYELVTRLENAIVRHAKGWDAFQSDIPRLIRQAIDEVIDAPRLRRFVLSELEKTEKTYIGTKIEILLRNHLALERGKVLDVRVDGIEVDIKNTIGSGWMIPKEALGHPCILIKADEEKSLCSFGILVMEAEVLTGRPNQDGKKSVSSSGLSSVHWLLRDAPYPRNFWQGVSPEILAEITGPTAGTPRLVLLFRRFMRIPISRETILALAPQKDTLKRLRKNGGARDQLMRDGVALLSGKYHGDLIHRLGLPDCGPTEFISIRPTEKAGIDLLRKAGELP
jgi:hypothetical protein